MGCARVLVVDDNLASVELAAFLLEEAGYEVDVRLDGSRLLERAAHARPDLILLDMQLPGIDGLTLAAALKQDPRTSDIPIVAFTAYAMRGDEARMRAAGCDAYIAKPLNVADFTARVQAVLARP